MSPLLKLTGQKFNRLQVISYHGRNYRGGTMWNCLCDCGNYSIVQGSNLKSGNTRSCGCLVSEINAAFCKGRAIHGMEGSPEYFAWGAMKSRCLNPRMSVYANYGGRGIRVCERWLKFENFYA